jgi:hypothetical protein
MLDLVLGGGLKDAVSASPDFRIRTCERIFLRFFPIIRTIRIFLDTVRSNIQKMGQLIDDLLTLKAVADLGFYWLLLNKQPQ